MKVALIQMNVGMDKSDNLARAKALIDEACADGNVDLISLPECFHFFGGSVDEQRAAAEPCPGGKTYQLLSDLARTHGIYVHCGSMNERAGETIHNTTLVFDRDGREVARYRKIHMFAITTPDGQVYDEGRLYQAGSDVVTFQLDGVTVGCTICYDIRFPELFRRLVDAGAEIILMPAAFTLQTGKEHWEPLLRARAIETQTFILAAAQEGLYEEDGEVLSTYGHSMIVEPWGGVIARRPTGDGVVVAKLDLDDVATARRRIPLAQHRRIS